MTEKSQDESAETLSPAEETGPETESSSAPTEDSPAEDSSAEPEGPAQKQEIAADTASAGEPSGPAAPGPQNEVSTAAPSGSSAPSKPPAPAVRWSRPTPARPMPADTSSSDTDLSSFFDNLDERFTGFARRIGSAFRRPDAASQPPADPHTAAAGNPSAPGTRHEAAAAPGRNPSQADLDGRARDPESAPVSLPRPRRALDEQRQRDVILKKAAAIEAATASNHRPRGRELIESADEEEDLFTYIPPYNLPSRDPDPAPVRTDLYRQIFVTVGALSALVSLIWMFGLFTDAPAILGGNGLEELADGWYSGNQALLSPAANFYWLWPIIVLGMLAHAVHQWTTGQTSTPRQRRSGWQVGAASLLMLVWTAAVHAGMLTLSVLASLAAALALIDAIRQFTFRTARTGVERRFADTTTGLFAGWAMVAAVSSLSVWLTAMGWRIPGIPAVIWALLGLGVCIWVAAYYAMTERGRITVALGLGWGMFWLIFPRLLSETTSVWVAISAAMGAFVVILATESRRHKINHAERRAAMGRPLEDII